MRAEKRKPLVKTVGILTLMPSALDRRFWLEDILIALRVTWLDGLNIFGDAIGQKKIDIFDSCQVLSQHESEILNDLDQRLSFLLACIRLKLSGDVFEIFVIGPFEK